MRKKKDAKVKKKKNQVYRSNQVPVKTREMRQNDVEMRKKCAKKNLPKKKKKMSRHSKCAPQQENTQSAYKCAVHLRLPCPAHAHTTASASVDFPAPGSPRSRTSSGGDDESLASAPNQCSSAASSSTDSDSANSLWMTFPTCVGGGVAKSQNLGWVGGCQKSQKKAPRYASGKIKNGWVTLFSCAYCRYS